MMLFLAGRARGLARAARGSSGRGGRSGGRRRGGRSGSGLGKRRARNQGGGDDGDEVLQHRCDLQKNKVFALLSSRGCTGPYLESARIITEKPALKCLMTAK